MFSELFTDDLFNPKGASLSPQATSPFTSPRVSGSPSLQTQPLLDHEVDLGRLAKEDPLATQVWKMYARQKAQLPHAQRMENLTWRMMALALKKKKDEESRMNAELTNEPPGTPSQPDVSPDLPSSTDTSEARNELGERGRRIDKGKARVRVIGFDGTNEDGLEEDE
jgi:GATA-binding protein